MGKRSKKTTGFRAPTGDPDTWPRTRKPHIADRYAQVTDEFRARYDRGDPETWDEYDPATGSRTIRSLGESREPLPGERCAWCRRQGHKLHNYDVLGTVEWLCCWACCWQHREYRLKRRNELDTLIALGHIPRRLPKWYMDKPTLDSLIATHHKLRETLVGNSTMAGHLRQQGPANSDDSPGAPGGGVNDQHLRGVNERASEMAF